MHKKTKYNTVVYNIVMVMFGNFFRSTNKYELNCLVKLES